MRPVATAQCPGYGPRGALAARIVRARPTLACDARQAAVAHVAARAHVATLLLSAVPARRVGTVVCESAPGALIDRQEDRASGPFCCLAQLG